MTDTYFCIPGDPVGKGRPRAFIRNKHVGMYTPKKTVNYEALVKMMASQSHKGEPFLGPVFVEIHAYFSIPLSMKKTDRELAEKEYLPVLKKPDADNIVKAICDAMNGVVYRDDAQVCDLTVRKRYSKNPRVIVIVNDQSKRIVI